MTNLEALEQFNKIVKPYLGKNPNEDLTDFLYWADSYSREVNGVPLLMKSNDNFIVTLKEYIEYITKGGKG